MPRARRSDDHTLHHITSRGNNRRSIFEDVHDRETFYGILAKALAQTSVLCHLDVLMGNHYHFFLEGPMPEVSLLLWSVNYRYALAYNARHERINHLFGRRFHCTAVADERGAQAVSVYIALNPVRAGFCEAPGEWPYGSFRVYAGDAVAPPYLTTSLVDGLFGPGRTLADACAEELGTRTPGRPPLEKLLPSRAELTRVHVRQAIRIFGYTDEEIARYYAVSVRTLYRWLAG